MATPVDGIIDNAQKILADTAGTRWPDAELVLWVNEAQRVISNNVDDAYILRADLTSVVGSIQDASVLISFARVIDIPRLNNAGNRSLIRGDRKLLDAVRPGWRGETPTTLTEMWMYDENEPTKFEVFPPITVSVPIEVVYSGVPITVNIGGNISIPDKYSPAILEYTLYRAFSKDTEDVATDVGRAGAHLAAFATLIGIKQGMDQIVRPGVI